ncbi:hypothetical protein EW146_g1451 [Bondarzewia mesenterica]|uniref:1-(5-phosphoribosyl)-5-[(5-phosphoribosylamino)methylideneamino] imidazole-4-carboxamide isomerase n=1 Tax=Bondarzewia mesenterica TaxID=1095465 RepID=A0A4S4M3U9_9AGAM|nr:hypothetical protein EW146_g1451 [Bondarzewia mesenterica]
MSSPASRNAILRLMNAAQHTACPCHGCRAAAGHAYQTIQHMRKLATPVNVVEKEYAFELAASNLRFGDGVTREVGMDLKNMKATKVGVLTDSNIAKLPPMKMALESLSSQVDLPFEVYDRVVTEPTEDSWRETIAWARQHNFSHFLAVGGGSVIDTAKAANLFTVYGEADLFDFINAPVGKGLPIDRPLRPLIAGMSFFVLSRVGPFLDSMFSPNNRRRAMKPTLGIVDTFNTESCPTAVHISSGLDVLFHSLESYTAIPYTERTPRPANPILRPAYQGSNPVADIFSFWALQQTVQHLPRVAKNRDDTESRRQLLLASSFAGIGFGNAGVHLCHGMSYPISGLNKKGPKYQHPGYIVDHPIIPHGVSVAITGPAVFQFTAPSSPDRHRQALAVFKGAAPMDPSITSIPDSEIGVHLYEAIASFLDGLGVPRGLKAVGYTAADVPRLVEGTLPQRRVLDLAPGRLYVLHFKRNRSEFNLARQSESPGDFARLYREKGIEGGHLIKLGPGNDEAAREALKAWPGGLQIGGGINGENAREWIDLGASKVIVTSYLFLGMKLSLERLQSLCSLVGKDRLVVDVSHRAQLSPTGGQMVIASSLPVETPAKYIPCIAETLDILSEYCSEFLIHAADVEGLCQGIDEALVTKLGEWVHIPTTYAGGAKDISDLDLVDRLSNGKIDLTYGSALDIFGGNLYHPPLAYTVDDNLLKVSIAVCHFLDPYSVVLRPRDDPSRFHVILNGPHACIVEHTTDFGSLTPDIMPGKVKAYELQSKSKNDLTKQLNELKNELLTLRVQKIAGGSASKLTKINTVRKSIARVLTVTNHKQRQNLRDFYKNKKYLPLDLRPKRTRAIRRRLTPHEKSLKTVKQHKKDIHFPLRKYAVKA